MLWTPAAGGRMALSLHFHQLYFSTSLKSAIHFAEDMTIFSIIYLFIFIFLFSQVQVYFALM